MCSETLQHISIHSGISATQTYVFRCVPNWALPYIKGLEVSDRSQFDCFNNPIGQHSLAPHVFLPLSHWTCNIFSRFTTTPPLRVLRGCVASPVDCIPQRHHLPCLPR